MRIMVPPNTAQALAVGEVIGALFATAAASGPGEALKIARGRGMSAGVIEILQKAPVGPTVPLTAQQQTVLLSATAPYGAFDRLAADSAFRPAPLEAPVRVVSVGLTAGERAIGAPIKLSALEIEGDGALTPRSVATITVLTRELMAAVGTQAEALFSAELRSAIARATDVVFVGEALAAAAGGATAPDLAGAIASVVGALPTSATSKVYVVVPPGVARGAASASGPNGPIYPQMGIGGGSVGMLPVVVSDALPADVVLALDGSRIVANAGTVELNTAKSASLQMTDTPAPGPQNLVNLWQANSVGLRATRQFGFALTEGAVAKCQIEP